MFQVTFFYPEDRMRIIDERKSHQGILKIDTDHVQLFERRLNKEPKQKFIAKHEDDP